MDQSKCKQYTIQVNLPEEDALRLAKKAGAYGLTVGRLMEHFVADLVNGIYSNGSDERMYADMWFERCGFGMSSDKTFLQYLLDYGLEKEILSLWAELQDIKSDIAYYEENPDKAEPGEVAEIREVLQDCQEQINGYWNAYLQLKTENEKGTFDEEMKKVLAWQEEWRRWNSQT